MNVGIVGLGRMGSRMAQRLAACGFNVIAWDRNQEAVETIKRAGITVARDPRTAVDAADVMVTCVTEDSAVWSVFTGAEGFLTGDVRGKLFVEMSTLRPRTAHELAPLVERLGGALIDSPVLGSVSAIADGQLLALVGGGADDVERAQPIHRALTRSVVHLGAIGSGYAMKLVANVGLAVYVEALGEALAMGSGEGLSFDAMLGVLAQATTANAWIANRREILTGETDDVTLDIRTMRKDLVSAMATGSATGVSMPTIAGALSAYSAAVASGWGDGDIGQMAKFVRDDIVQRYD